MPSNICHPPTHLQTTEIFYEFDIRTRFHTNVRQSNVLCLLTVQIRIGRRSQTSTTDKPKHHLQT